MGGDPTSGPGVLLREGREALSVSVGQVAKTLKLSVSVIESIEANDFNELPVPAFTRGYIRAYAKLIMLDADQLVHDYDLVGLGNEPALVVDPQRTDFRELPQRYPGWVLGGSVVAVVLVSILVLWIVWPEETDITDAYSNVETPFVEPSAETINDFEQDSPDSGEEATAATNEMAGPLVLEDYVREPETTDEVLEESILVEGSEALAFQQHLRFEFSDDCWVEVRDRTGAIYTDLNRRGQDLNLRGEAPFTITLGYVPGVYLEYNEEPVALSPHTRNNVATLVLGQ